MLADEVQDVFCIAMRTYFEKSRTTLGWKGLLYDPHLDDSHDMHEGILLSRKLLQDVTEMGLATATEFLDPLASYYISDYICWGSIGARTCQSPIHRQLASALHMPVGFKNRTDGNVDTAIGAVVTAKCPHQFLGIDDDGCICKVTGSGNPYPHLVLRGGEDRPNYDPLSIEWAARALRQANLAQTIIVDCSHDNSQKKYWQQPKVFSFLIDQVRKGYSPIRGLMLESFLLAGNQDAAMIKDMGVSITDPCLDWQMTEEIIRQNADVLRHNREYCNVR
jgi:3-deoxy-7-phosphoheptulonate synthase